MAEVCESPSAIPATSSTFHQVESAQPNSDRRAAVVDLAKLPVLYRLSDLFSRPLGERVVYCGPLPYQGLDRLLPHHPLNRILRWLFRRWVLSHELVRVAGERIFGIWKLAPHQSANVEFGHRTDMGLPLESQNFDPLTDAEWREFLDKWPPAGIDLPARILQASHPLRELLGLRRAAGRPEIQSLLAELDSPSLDRKGQGLTEGQS